MADSFGEELLEIACAQIIGSCGKFNSASSSALPTIASIARRQIEQIARTANRCARHAGRGIANAQDVARALQASGLETDLGLEETLGGDRPFARTVRPFPVPNQPRLPKPGNPREPHAPAWCPPLPDPHTYMSGRVKVTAPSLTNPVVRAMDRTSTGKTVTNLARSLSSASADLGASSSSSSSSSTASSSSSTASASSTTSGSSSTTSGSSTASTASTTPASSASAATAAPGAVPSAHSSRRRRRSRAPAASAVGPGTDTRGTPHGPAERSDPEESDDAADDGMGYVTERLKRPRVVGSASYLTVDQVLSVAAGELDGEAAAARNPAALGAVPPPIPLTGRASCVVPSDSQQAGGGGGRRDPAGGDRDGAGGNAASGAAGSAASKGPVTVPHGRPNPAGELVAPPLQRLDGDGHDLAARILSGVEDKDLLEQSRIAAKKSEQERERKRIASRGKGRGRGSRGGRTGPRPRPSKAKGKGKGSGMSILDNLGALGAGLGGWTNNAGSPSPGGAPNPPPPPSSSPSK